MSDTIKILVNGVIALAIVVAVILHAIAPELAIAGVVLLLMPSAGPELVAKLRSAIARSSGPSILLPAVISLSTFGALNAGCASPAAKAPASSPPCQGLTVDECSAQYGGELTACSLFAKTRAESEACEDDARARYHRPPRAPSSSSRPDGGAS